MPHNPSLSKSAPAPWPKRAVVTAGMPYGNKNLHFGHVGGVFVPADCFARFLRDRIGKDNVIFVSGTDCYGSPIEEGYRKEVEAGTFEGTIEEYVERNHNRQAETLEAYDISLDLFAGSGFGHAGEVHQVVSQRIVEHLYKKGYLHLESTLQFYDPEAEMFLNGRQVVGRCPVQGCKGEKGYADECDMGHQYEPEDLINPISSITGVKPEMRKVSNWYFDLPDLSYIVSDYEKAQEKDPQVRALVPKTIGEFLVPPIIYIKQDFYEAYLSVADALPAHVYRAPEKGKQSFEIEFPSLEERDKARSVLGEAGIQFRTGKALVPFRISGNVSWGVPVPEIDGVKGLTFWCWPESLWAPISFTVACKDLHGCPRGEWRKFWCDKDATVYQFIGQDNLYFYGVAQPALFAALQDKQPVVEDAPNGFLQQTKLVANHHILFGDKKASSSGAVKPPSAAELLDYYTPEQLRAHFLALALDQKSVGFKPKVFETDPVKRDDPRVADPALKEGTMLAKVFNRIPRSCLYAAYKYFDGYMPLGKVTDEVLEMTDRVLARYDHLMYKVELHSVMTLMDTFIRDVNKYWTDNTRIAEQDDDQEKRRQTLLDTFFMLRIATLLMHPIVPAACERICDYLNFDFDEFFSWNYDFTSMDELCNAHELSEGRHRVRELPPRTDFFKLHPTQIKDKKKK